jgi:hypothetical protein
MPRNSDPAWSVRAGWQRRSESDEGGKAASSDRKYPWSLKYSWSLIQPG